MPARNHLLSVRYLPLGMTVWLVNDLLQLVSLFGPVQTQRISQQPYSRVQTTSHRILRQHTRSTET